MPSAFRRKLRRQPFESEARSFLFRFGRREVCVATKPWLVSRLLDEGFDAVVYLDADMLVTGDLSEMMETAARVPVALTPHHLAPVDGPAGAKAWWDWSSGWRCR